MSARLHPIARRRAELGLTQEQFARSANLSETQVNQWEQGVTKKPHARSLVKMATILGTDADTISAEIQTWLNRQNATVYFIESGAEDLLTVNVQTAHNPRELYELLHAQYGS